MIMNIHSRFISTARGQRLRYRTYLKVTASDSYIYCTARPGLFLENGFYKLGFGEFLSDDLQHVISPQRTAARRGK